MPTTAEALRLEAKIAAGLAEFIDAQERDLVAAWAVAWDEISTEIRDTLTELAAAAESGTLTAATLRRSRRLTEALTLAQKRLEALALAARIRINSDIGAVVDQAGRAQARLIASMLPKGQKLVEPDAWDRLSPRALDAMVKRVTEQITALHKPLAPAAYDAMRRELVRTVVVGSNPRVTARRMVARAKEEFDGGLTRALNISRTEVVDAHREAARAGQAQHADVLTGWMWLAHLSPRTCRSCLGMHGRIFDLEVPGPEDHPQGRCVRMPTTKPWSELGFDVEEPPSVVPDADDFFDDLTPAEQRSLLGRRGYEAWLAGEFPREAWAEKRHNEGWRDAIVPAKPPAEGAAGGAGGNGSTPPAPPGGVDPIEPAAGGSDDLPPMGRTIGTWQQQVYVKDGTPYPIRYGQHGLPLAPSLIDDANAWHTYVPDDQDRTTALIQYLKSGEVLVKKVAKDQSQGRARTKATEDLITEFFDALEAQTSSGVAGSGYDRSDLVADIEGAAARLLRRPEEALGTVFRGMRIDGFDPRFDDLKDLPALIQTGDWWFRSASTAYETAKSYSGWPFADTPMVMIITGARGVLLESMGRMSESPEVLLTGGVELTGPPRIVNGLVLIRARWKA